jgi:hypothetical protein
VVADPLAADAEVELAAPAVDDAGDVGDALGELILHADGGRSDVG